MRTSDPKYLEAIERVESMSYREQLRWASDAQDPWKGMKLPQTRVDREKVNVVDGHITRMPPLGGRPCFGNPIAWAVHGRIETITTRNGSQPTRCGRCKARAGCERVGEARLSLTPEIREADGAFRAAGGRRALRSKNPDAARRALGRLIQLFDAHGRFTSINDQFAREWVSAQRDHIRKLATERKRKERAKAVAQTIRAGQIPEVIAEQMERERQHRAIRYRQFARSGSAPPAITVDPNEENHRFTADVWLARERLAIMRKPTTPYGIATHMIERERSYGLTHTVLRDRARKAITRISLLENTPMPGEVEAVWPTFDVKATVSDLLAETPYEDAD